MVIGLNAFEFCEEKENNTDNIKNCLNNGLIKYWSDDSEPLFLAMEKDIPKIKEILQNEYQKITEMSLIELIQWELPESTYSIKVKFLNNAVEVTADYLFDIISDDLELYIGLDLELEIYNSANPQKKLKHILNEFGRNELEHILKNLLKDVKNCTFK